MQSNIAFPRPQPFSTTFILEKAMPIRKGHRFVRVPEVVDPLQRIHQRAAGVDAHAREHFVAVPLESVPPGVESVEPQLPKHVRRFGTNTADLRQLADWLLSCQIATVAVESTGVYHLALVEVLEERGLEVVIVDPRQTAHAPGRPKSDVLDCQWIQRLHAYGLLRASFRPGPEIRKLREYQRERDMMVRYAASHIHHMQKALEQMNCKLPEVVSDITGRTGMLIIKAIVRGVRDPLKLAKYRNERCRSTEAEIAAALQGTWAEEHLFSLRTALKLYEEYHRQLRVCEEKIEECLRQFADRSSGQKPEAKPRRRGRTNNDVTFDVRGLLFRMTGVDVTVIEGIDERTALTLVSELGYDLSKFATARHFTSWLGLSPKHRGSARKIQWRGVGPQTGHAAQAFRMAASGCHRAHHALGAFYRRIAARAGGAKAVIATARKIAERFYRLLTTGQSYERRGAEEMEQHYAAKVVKGLQKKAESLGFQLVPIEVTQ